LDGVLPLSFTVDSAGPIAKSVADCALLDQVLAAEDKDFPTPAHLRGLRLAVPKTVFQNDLSPAVADSFRAALTRLSAAGATVVELPMAEFAQAAAVNPRGALTSAEAYSWHRQWMKDGADKYDPRVIVRIRPGETMTAANYIELMKLRAQFIRQRLRCHADADHPGHRANDRRSQQGRRNVYSPQPAHAAQSGNRQSVRRLRPVGSLP
jgi:aspartyl-tRNA(Asn)/glutamyl-tRNA(Gln) amidotransferase subunit A